MEETGLPYLVKGQAIILVITCSYMLGSNLSPAIGTKPPRFVNCKQARCRQKQSCSDLQCGTAF